MMEIYVDEKSTVQINGKHISMSVPAKEGLMEIDGTYMGAITFSDGTLVQVAVTDSIYQLHIRRMGTSVICKESRNDKDYVLMGQDIKWATISKFYMTRD